MVAHDNVAHILEVRRTKEQKIKEQLKTGEIMPTQRRIGHRKYHQRLPEFKELDTDMPTTKNIEGSNEPLKYANFKQGSI